MPFRVFVTPDAKADIRQAKQWLEQQKPALSLDFRADLRKTLANISQNPFAYGVVHKTIRQVRLSKFLHVVSYSVSVDSVQVIAVIHGHRDPEEWMRRVK